MRLFFLMTTMFFALVTSPPALAQMALVTLQVQAPGGTYEVTMSPFGANHEVRIGSRLMCPMQLRLIPDILQIVLAAELNASVIVFATMPQSERDALADRQSLYLLANKYLEARDALVKLVNDAETCESLEPTYRDALLAYLQAGQNWNKMYDIIPGKSMPGTTLEVQ